MSAPATVDEIKSGTARAFGPTGTKGATPAPETPAATPAPTDNNPAEPNPTPEPTPTTEDQAPAAKVNLDEISDEDLERLLAKRTKGAVKSLSDIIEPKRKTKEEIEQEEAAEQSEALTFAISTGKIKKDDYEKAIAAKSKSKRDIAFDIFSEELTAIDENITPEEIESIFADRFGENEADTSWKHKKGLADINKLADSHLAQFADYDNERLTSNYRAHKGAEQNKSLISKQVDKVFDTVANKLDFEFSYLNASNQESKVQMPYDIDESDMKAIKRDAKKNIVGFYAQMGVNAVDVKEADLLEAINTEIKARLFDKVMSTTLPKVAQKAKEETEVYYKNIPVRNPQFGQNTPERTTQQRTFTDEERRRMPGRN